MKHLPHLNDTAIRGKRVVLRADLNVPLDPAGCIASDARIRAVIPTLHALLKRDVARILIVSHLGRPKGHFEPRLSLAKVASRLGTLLGQSVPLIGDWLNREALPKAGVMLAENVRFLVGEKENDPALARRMAGSSDVLVMDAFATAHRAHASTTGLIDFIPQACAGPLFVAEMEALSRVMHHPKHPLVAVVGGAKIASKLGVLKSLVDKADALILGGGIANTFLAARGYAIGQSLYDADDIDRAKAIDQIARIDRTHSKIHLPTRVVVSDRLSDGACPRTTSVEQVSPDEMILDWAPESVKQVAPLLQQAKTILWSGALGVFENPTFRRGTQALVDAMGNAKAFTVAGGGDTVSAIEKLQRQATFSYISTAGGAFLSYISEKPLPVVEALQAMRYAYAGGDKEKEK